MALVLNGSGITSANIVNGTIVDEDVADVAASKLTGALPAISGAALTNLPGGGKVLQVVSGHKSDTFTTTSASFTDITGLTATITPSSTSSKILVICSIAVSNASATYGTQIRLLRGATSIAGGDLAGSRQQSIGQYSMSVTHQVSSITTNYLDSPASTSATIYKAQGLTQSGSGGLYINRSGDDADVSQHGRYASTITLMEIGA